MRIGIYFIASFFLFIACTDENKAIEQIKVTDSIIEKTTEEHFMFTSSQDTIKNDGEHIKRYKNGVIEKQGMMKNGKRDGLWKSFYENGSPWSETTFKDGIKNGKTTTWYPNGQKRYDGFYTNDIESGVWNFYDESGFKANTTNYDEKK